MPPKINFVERNKQNIASKKTAVKKEVVDKASGASKDKEKEKENKPVRTSSAATSIRPRPLAKTNSSRPVSAPVKPKSITKCFAHQYKYFLRCSNLAWYKEKAINCD